MPQMLVERRLQRSPLGRLRPHVGQLEMKKSTRSGRQGSKIHRLLGLSNGSSDRGMSRLERSTEDFQVGTQRLTALCQKQVNFWHDLSALTDDEIAGVKKIGKISILYRNKNSIQFIDYLDKGNRSIIRNRTHFRKMLQSRDPLSCSTDTVSATPGIRFSAREFSSTRD